MNLPEKQRRYLESGRREYHSQYFKENKPHMLITNLQWRQEYPEIVSRYNRDYYTDMNPNAKIYQSKYTNVRPPSSSINRHLLTHYII